MKPIGSRLSATDQTKEPQDGKRREHTSPKCSDFSHRSAAKSLAGPATRPCDTH